MHVQVRHQKESIDLPLIQEAIDKRQLGLATGKLPDTPAKRRLATVEAGRAVALALTPGIPPLERLTIAPRGPILSRLTFAEQVQHMRLTGNPILSPFVILSCTLVFMQSDWGILWLSLLSQCIMQATVAMC